jgi:hypothetical protein
MFSFFSILKKEKSNFDTTFYNSDTIIPFWFLVKITATPFLQNNTLLYLVIKYIIVNLQTLFERGMFNQKNKLVWTH